MCVRCVFVCVVYYKPYLIFILHTFLLLYLPYSLLLNIKLSVLSLCISHLGSFLCCMLCVQFVQSVQLVQVPTQTSLQVRVCILYSLLSFLIFVYTLVYWEAFFLYTKPSCCYKHPSHMNHGCFKIIREKMGKVSGTEHSLASSQSSIVSIIISLLKLPPTKNNITSL